MEGKITATCYILVDMYTTIKQSFLKEKVSTYLFSRLASPYSPDFESCLKVFPGQEKSLNVENTFRHRVKTESSTDNESA